MKQCSVDGCGRVEYLAHGFCDKHYKRWKKHGNPHCTGPTAEQRFWSKVDTSSSCWLWRGATARGYGVFNVSRAAGLQYAHRFAFESLVRPIPEGLTLDHLCRQRLCVNPEHLEPVTLAENIRRGAAARRLESEAARPLQSWEVA